MANVIQTFPKGTGGGHTILDDSGAAVLDRKEMQFKGLSVTDNSTDEVTEVEAPGLSAESLADVTSGEITNFVITGGNTYSTNEQIVGRWIDGKPIYQKTYKYNGSINMNNSHKNVSVANINDLNIDTIVNIGGNYKTADVGFFYNICYSDIRDTRMMNSTVFIAEGSLRVSAYRSDEYTTVMKDITITIQYTKTTDT